ncbi:MAG: T9SS type A sorting domain-containing protein [Lewinellaceae bacterium]|nr:T9SS type A sorting domain-containing protein [Lewinellaceae bacterium]
MSLLLCCLSTWSYAQTEVTIKDADLQGNQTYSWTNDKVYLLDGYVFLEAGSKLTIQAGTVIKGINTPTNGVDKASALIITRGAQIFAEGTKDAPIIFTAELDDVTDPTDLTAADKGLWGGVIILGNGIVGEDGGFDNIEGIPADEGRAQYGGDQADDNSGIIRYVSIRHGGAALQADNEINGLTLGGVGSATQIDHIEVFANEDDGIEWFGGNVDVKYAVTAFCGDDGFDYDESWAGRGQFWFYIQEPDNGNNGGEHDGSEKTDLTPKSFPTIYNATYIGSGAAGQFAASNAMDIRADAAVIYGNSIFTDFGNAGLRLRNRSNGDSYYRYVTTGETKFINNLWFGFGAGNTPDKFIQLYDNTNAATPGTLDAILALIVAQGNQVSDPLLAGISRQPNGGLDPRPSAGSPALSGVAAATDSWFDAVTYRGAFGYTNWAAGWTALGQYGYFGDLIPGGDIVIKDSDLVGNTNYEWTPNNTYFLDGYVFLEAGSKLTIQAGTVIKGINTPTNGVDKASALIITRGAQIFAEGTKDAPIIFTAELDDVTDPTDLTAADKGLWGGVIILGNGIVGEDGGFDNIEGIPADEGRAQYGGDQADDNSGIIRYVSIRHGGAALQADNEINGLTLGGVGSATQIDHIEVFANEDDGIEWFGGNVDVKYAVTAFCGDDGFDYDESWAGRGQFWFYIQEPDNGNNGGEHDGSEKTDLTPKSFPTIYNATYIGSGAAGQFAASNAMDIRADAAVIYGNSIFTDFGNAGLRLRNRSNGDSYYRYVTTGETKFLNNLWFGFGAGNTPDKFIQLYDNTNAATPGTLDAILALIVAQGNQVSDPLLAGISRQPNGGLDPRPSAGSPALSGAAAATDSWFDAVTYRGAFSNTENWAAMWTALAEYGFFGDLVVTNTIELDQNSRGVRLASPAPNPAVNEAYVDLQLPGASEVAVLVYDLGGRLIDQQQLGRLAAGENRFFLNVQQYQSGMYILAVKTQYGVVTRKFAVTSLR